MLPHIYCGTVESVNITKIIEYVQDRPGHDLRYSIDNAKIQSELGWTPKYSPESGLEKTIKWYKNDRF